MKRGQLNADTVTQLGVIAIVGAVVVLILSNIRDTFEGSSTEANITDKGIASIENFFDLLPTLGTILIAIILIAAVLLIRQRQS